MTNLRYAFIFTLFGLLALMKCYFNDGISGQIISVYVAFNCLALAGAYAFRWPGLWQKRSGGGFGATSYVLLAPLHLLNWLSLRLAISLEKGKPFHEILPSLWLGRRLLSHEVGSFPHNDQLAVLDLTSEFAENATLRSNPYLCLPVLDHTTPTRNQIDAALKFIDQHIATRPVYVHCALGHGRSATVIAAWLLQQRFVTDVDAALAHLKSIRSGVSLNSEQRAMLYDSFPEKSHL